MASGKRNTPSRKKQWVCAIRNYKSSRYNRPQVTGQVRSIHDGRKNDECDFGENYNITNYNMGKETGILAARHGLLDMELKYERVRITYRNDASNNGNGLKNTLRKT